MKKGFTLIELLVVISIIGLLAAAGLATFTSAQKRARDARRKSDLHNVSLALEQYYAANQTYKVTGGGWRGGGNGWLSISNGNPLSYPKSVTQVLYEDGYLTNANIEDPKGPGSSRAYMIYLCDSNQVYSLYATLENGTAEELDFAKNHTCAGSVTLPPGGGGYGKNYAVSNQYL